MSLATNFSTASPLQVREEFFFVQFQHSYALADAPGIPFYFAAFHLSLAANFSTLGPLRVHPKIFLLV